MNTIYQEPRGMSASSGRYPSLGRYFRTLKELADAGCMSRQRARDCLDGVKEFTEQEKMALARACLINRMTRNMNGFGLKEMNDLDRAMEGGEGFDEVFKI